MNRFRILNQDQLARAGTYETAHGAFETPNFMPVGTQATVKGIDCERIKEAGAQITLVNTYHLWLRPGPEAVHERGGIHKFMGWHGPILSDSGGFQVFSLENMRTITEEGAEFRSHLDGAKMFLSPEKAVSIQETLGVDIAMVLDECPKASSSYDEFEKSLALTLRWAKRCKDAKQRENLSLFGITQGGFHKDLRKRSAEALSEIGFDGYAIGGLSVGEPKEVMHEVLSYHPEDLPHDRIRYVMGVGTPEDLIVAVSRGIDLFDCVMPTRSGRFGRAFINDAEPWINIRNARFQTDDFPLDGSCACVACRNYSRSYIHHLFRAEEMLGPILLSTHNLTHYLTLMSQMRSHIRNGSFSTFSKEILSRWHHFEKTKEGKSLSAE